jgi:sterol desaturase/sphingolipid hydroxylase (fatty acid hydroxylase superfamily)
MQLVSMLLIILALNGGFMLALSALAQTELARRHRQRPDRVSRVDPRTYQRGVMTNVAVSIGLLFGVTLPLRPYLVLGETVGVLRTLGEAALILSLYDFGYYLLHRFAFHKWSVGRRIHAVHHSIRTPYARDSLYIHPAETAAGVGLCLGCTALIGPVGLSSFGLAFLIYSLLNVFIHSSIDLRFFPFRSLTALVRHHDIHHDSMRSGYYASITPLWDLIFGTASSPHEARPV